MVAEKVVVQLVLDTSRYTGQAQKAAKSTGQIQQSVDKTSKSMGGFQSTALKAGAALGAAFAAKTVLDFAKSSINAFSNLEESINAVNVIYGEGSAAIVELGKTSATQFGLSTTAVNEAAVAMGAFAEKIDAADPPGAFQNVLQRATDFASVMNLETNEALRLFQSGLAGESEPLRKFGVDVSAATIQATALAEGIWDGNGAMSEGEKVQARYATIMAQTAKTAGDFANTSDSLANTQKILSAQWKEAQADLGKKLAPAMTKLLSAGRDLIPVFGFVADVFADLVDAAGPLFTALELLSGAAGGFGDSLNAAGEEGDSFGDKLRRVQAETNKTNLWTSLIGVVSQAKTEFIDGGEAVEGFDLAAAALRIRMIGLKESIEGGADVIPPFSDDTNTVGESAYFAADGFQAMAAGIRDSISAAQEAANPALALLKAQQRVVAAEKELQDARVAGKPITQDVIAATADLIEAELSRDAAAAAAVGTLADGTAIITEYGEASITTAGEVAALNAEIAATPTTRNIEFTATYRGFDRLESLTGGTSRRGGVDVEAKQHGGPVTAGDPFLVGERGPELFIPDSAGRIVANSKLGGGGVTVNVNQPTTTDLASDISAGLIAGQVTQLVEGLRV